MIFVTPASAIDAPFEPTQIALGPDGNVYAIMAGNESVCNHIFVFAPDGRVLKDFDTHAWSMALDVAGNLYVLNATLHNDSTDYSVWKYDRNGTVTVIWSSDGDRTHPEIGAMAVSPDGHVYINRFYNDRDTGAAVNESELKVNGIVRLDDNGTEHIVFAETSMSPTRGFHSMAIDANGTIYAVDIANFIRVLSPDGTGTSIGNAGSANGTFSMITGVAIGQDGYLYVAEYGNRRVQKLTLDGNFVAKWNGAGPDQFIYPYGATADKDGKVYVADGHNQRIVWFTPDYIFGENSTGNLKGQGTTWGNVIAGANYTTVMKQIEDEKAAAASTPGFAGFAVLIGIGLGAVLYCLRK